MPSPIIPAKALSVNPEAHAFHDNGLQAELAGDFPAAHHSFDQARMIAMALPRTVDSVVQHARIVRDDGFTDVRAALATENPGLLKVAERTLKRSVDITAPLVSGSTFLGLEREQPHDTPKLARREAFAEHGASVSLLGRLATVKAVMANLDTRGDTVAATHARRVDQQPYGLAHDILKAGNNGYYLVSNAMVGARQERLNGRLPHMAKWLGRAAHGLVWTALRDSENTKAALKTAAGRLMPLYSYAAARKSVVTKP